MITFNMKDSKGHNYVVKHFHEMGDNSFLMLHLWMTFECNKSKIVEETYRNGQKDGGGGVASR